ncbi:MAG TPA: DUF3891 family protein [Dehalococcoidia bacterium]|nr:DUF3891 family protein [Dehalococcoidia bacterium]
MAMVSRFDDSRLIFVRQIDHSEVVGFFAAHWGNDVFERPRPYASVALAAQEHDKGWAEWEMRPTLSPDGRPLDYQGGGLDQLGFHSRNMDRLLAVDPYAGLVNLMHNVGLLNSGYGLMLPEFPSRMHEPGAPEFVERYEELRPKVVAQLRETDEFRDSATEEHIWENYRLMQIFDLMGQYFCNRYPLTRPERPFGPNDNLRDMKVPLRYGGDQTTITIDIVDDFRAVIDPYPFDVDPLVVRYPARLLLAQPYGSQEDFLHDYYSGERLVVTLSLQSASSA